MRRKKTYNGRLNRVCVYARLNLKEKRMKGVWVVCPIGLVGGANSLEGGVCVSHGSGG